MFRFKLFILFVILKSVVSYKNIISNNWDFWESVENNKTSYEETSRQCETKDHSLISNSDLKYLIENTAIKLRVKEGLANNYCPKAKELHAYYLLELKELQNELEDRPGHMLHILDDFADRRVRWQPELAAIEAQMLTFEVREEKYKDIAERSGTLLKQLERYKKMCKINCEEIDIETRLKTSVGTDLQLHYSLNNNASCVKLQELLENVTAELSKFQEEFERDLQTELINRNESYAQKFKELKMNLKNAAVKEFGMTMYDMLSLQDDYHHLFNSLKHNNISLELDRIEENSAEIKLKLIGLKRDVEKYRQYCMSCNGKRRDKRSIWTEREYEEIYNSYLNSPIEHIKTKSNIVDELIRDKIKEIKYSIQTDCNAMFDSVEVELNNPDVIDSYVSKLKPIQDNVEYEIKREQEALEALRNRVPESTIQKVVALSKESQQMIKSLEDAKQYVDQFNLV